MIRALHVETLRHEDLHAEHEPHVLFQASTIGALLDAAYEGDVTFDELAQHGDLGHGTLNALDGEMIAVDGRFYRCDVDGVAGEVEGSARTPFAVVVDFAPTVEAALDDPLDNDVLLAEIDRVMPQGAVACALRIDGEFDLVRARSVPRQTPPYRPLTEVVADQHEFEFHDAAGSVVGFRFPYYSQGIELAGYHLHFITADRTRGGHVLELRVRSGGVQIDPSADLRVELPSGVDLAAPDLSEAARDALRNAET